MAISRRSFIRSATASAVALAIAPTLGSTESRWNRYETSVIIDGLGFPGGMGTEPGTPLTSEQVADIRASGLTATHLTVGPVGTMPTTESYAQTTRGIAFWNSEIAANPEALALVRSIADIDLAKAGGRTGLIYGMQDGVAFETDLSRLDALHGFGIRIVQPTYNRRNLLGDGCMEPANAGLSRSGHEAIEKMNAIGILVDLSHCGRRTAADAIAISSKPVAFTHTGCAALVDHPRHRTDDEMRAVAATGGVTGIYVMPYLTGGRQPAAADVVRHLLHAIDVCGEDHVAVGTDGGISPVDLTPEYKAAFRSNVIQRRESGIAAPGETEEGYLFASDLNIPDRFDTLAGLLLAEGVSEAAVTKVMGNNLIRVYNDAWST